jgi:hypothetical protein
MRITTILQRQQGGLQSRSAPVLGRSNVQMQSSSHLLPRRTGDEKRERARSAVLEVPAWLVLMCLRAFLALSVNAAEPAAPTGVSAAISQRAGSATSAKGFPHSLEQRAFRMGFTGFPHDFTLEAVSEARQFLRENGDLIAHHIEGLPWAEALKNLPFSKALLDEWEGKKAATPPRGKVYLAISPGRGDLKVAEKGLPLPAELKGKSYEDQLVQQAFLNYCRRAIEFFKPDYLAIGIEVNEIYQAGADKWRAYTNLHQYIYQELKREHPTLPIFASFTLHGMLNLRGKARDGMLGAFQEIMPCNDFVAVSFYPFIAGGSTNYSEALAWMTANFDRYKKPYAVAETGEAAERLVFPKSGQVIGGTAEKQAAYYQALLALAQARQFKFVVSFIHRDYDALWEKIQGNSPEFFMAWRDCGLVDEKGNQRPAYAIWKRYFGLPLVE